jgi:hypothetical protein
MRIALVGSSRKTQSYSCTAREMYSASPRFCKAFAWCRAQYDKVYILSPRHGLLDPEDLIEPCDMQLSTMTKKARAQWAGMVAFQVHREIEENRIHEVELIALHASRKYRRCLTGHLEAIAPCEFPLEGMEIDEQLDYYTATGFQAH